MYHLSDGHFSDGHFSEYMPPAHGKEGVIEVTQQVRFGFGGYPNLCTGGNHHFFLEF